MEIVAENLLTLPDQLKDCHQRLVDLSKSGQDGGTWYRTHPIPTSPDLEKLEKEIGTCRKKMATLNLKIPTSSAELAIWLKDGANQSDLAQWLANAVELTEKLRQGACAASQKVPGFNLANFQVWPFKGRHERLLSSIEAALNNHLDAGKLTTQALEGNDESGDIYGSLMRYIPALTSPFEEIQEAARASYQKLTNIEAIPTWSNSFLTELLLKTGGKARASLDILLSAESRLASYIQAVNLTPHDPIELRASIQSIDRMISSFNNILERTGEKALALNFLLIMSYIEDHCSEDKAKIKTITEAVHANSSGTAQIA